MSSLVLLAACGGDVRDPAGNSAGTDGGIGTADPGPTEGGSSSPGDEDDVTTGEETTVSSGGIPDTPSCGEADFVLQAVPPNVVLVLDKSGSMVQNSWDADADESTPTETRWRSLHDVVNIVLGNFNDAINFGAVLFPKIDAVASSPDSACDVEPVPDVSVASQNAAAILEAIPAAGATSEIQGATPATAGIQTALDHLQTLDPTVPRFMILVTDGAANCSEGASCDNMSCPLYAEYDDNLPVVVGQASDLGIPTFVVGIDISSQQETNPNVVPFEALNAVAEAGGRPRDGGPDDPAKFFDARDEIQLEAALQEIAGQVVSCTIPLDPEPDYPLFVSIDIAGERIPKVGSCDEGDGWTFVNPDGPYDSIELCGTACDKLAEAGTLDATYGCKPPE